MISLINHDSPWFPVRSQWGRYNLPRDLVYPDISSTPGFKHQLVGLLALFYTQVFPHHPTGLQKVCKNGHSSLGSPKMQQFTQFTHRAWCSWSRTIWRRAWRTPTWPARPQAVGCFSRNLAGFFGRFSRNKHQPGCYHSINMGELLATKWVLYLDKLPQKNSSPWGYHSINAVKKLTYKKYLVGPDVMIFHASPRRWQGT